MPTKKTTQTPKNKTENKKRVYTPEQTELANNVLKFFFVSKALLSSDSPEMLNDTDEKWEYHQLARDIAREMGVNWDEMTYEQNNALILNMLIEHWAAIEDKKELKPIVRVVFDPQEP